MIPRPGRCSAIARLAAALWALGLAGGCVLHRLYLDPLPPQAELLEARTDDGWRLGVIRYRPPAARGLPVVLVHGIFNNGRVLDIDDEHSLARWLAGQGREVFVLNLRGTRYSDLPDPEAGRPAGHSADVYVTRDIPAAIRLALEKSGATKVDLVGHSMGGHLALMYLALGATDVNAAATFGTGMDFRGVGKVERETAVMLGWLGGALGETVPAPEIVHALAPLHGEIEGPIERAGRSALNTRVETWKRFMATGVDHTSRGVVEQLARCIERNALLSADGTVDYLELLTRTRTPVLFVAAKLDKIAPVASVKKGYLAYGGPKRLLVAGQENGFQYDYAHGDLVMADRARLELWPRVLAFFDEHAATCPQAAK